MLIRVPGKKYDKRIHRRCRPCTVAFYVAMPALLAVAALKSVPLRAVSEPGGGP